MKMYSLLFISFLFAISCTDDLLKFKPTPQEIEQTLVELNKEPLSEGIFATMATQLSTEGGFNRVVGLLNQLIDDGKDQLHGITKTWRGVQTRCTVSAMMLKSRKNFFQAQLRWTNKVIKHRHEDIADQGQLLKTFRASSKVLRAMHKASVARHARMVKNSGAVRKHAHAGLKLAKVARKQIKNWTAKGAALVQTMITKIMEGYTATSGHSVSDPTELIQRSSSGKVRSRLLQWINIIIGRIAMTEGTFAVSKKKVASFASYDKNLKGLATSLTTSSGQISKHISGANADVRNMKKSATLYSKLVGQTTKLIKSNKDYCAIESKNFHSNEKRITSEVKLFQQVLRYFQNHYSRVHSFIRSKYNH